MLEQYKVTASTLWYMLDFTPRFPLYHPVWQWLELYIGPVTLLMQLYISRRRTSQGTTTAWSTSTPAPASTTMASVNVYFAMIASCAERGFSKWRQILDLRCAVKVLGKNTSSMQDVVLYIYIYIYIFTHT